MEYLKLYRQKKVNKSSIDLATNFTFVNHHLVLSEHIRNHYYDSFQIRYKQRVRRETIRPS